jgi:hypothetical protein
MDDSIKFQRFAAITTLVAIPLAIGQAVTSLMAVNYDGGLWSHPSAIIAIGAAQAQILRWSMLLDVFGDYLLLIPLMLFLGSWLKPRSPNFVTFYTLCGLAYPLIGSLGAITLAAVLPPLIAQYAQAAASQRETLQIIFDSFMNVVYLGLWNPLEVLFFGVWFVGIGWLLRKERHILGMVTFVIGLFTLLDPLGKILQVDTIFLIGVGGMALLVPIWLVWIGIDLVRQPVQSIS